MATLDELDPPAWPDAESQSGLIATCHRLRRKPLDEFTTEDLRVMIGQRIAPNILLPLAVEQLINEPLASGDCYPGDLFVSCAKVCCNDYFVMERNSEDMRAVAQAILSDPPDDTVVVNAANSILTANGG
jgi:hypothetical protein